MSSFSNMHLEESQDGSKSAISSPIKKRGYFLKKKTAYIGIAVLAVVFIVALLIVYYSAKPSSKEVAERCPPPVVYTTDVIVPTTTPYFDLNKECSASVCRNPIKALGILYIYTQSYNGRNGQSQ